MSFTFTCDYCGAEIGDDEDWITLDTKGHGYKAKRRSGYIGHYHDTNAKPCFEAVWAAVKLVREYGSEIEAIPVASAQSIAVKRRRHTKPGDTAESEGARAQTRASDVTLHDLHLHVVAEWALRENGITKLADCVDYTRRELLAIDRVGPSTVDSIERALRERGLSLNWTAA